MNIDTNLIVPTSSENSSDVTYAQLVQLANTSGLTPGGAYTITDYATKYLQPISSEIKTCPVEPLIVVAKTTSKISPIAFSPAYPDDVIYYSLDDDVCEDTTTPRNGFIQRRIDTVRNIDIPNDWRFMTWARYQVDTTDPGFGSSTPWTSGAVTKGKFYITGDDISIAIATGTPTSSEDNIYFIPVLEGYAGTWPLYMDRKIYLGTTVATLTLDPTTKTDYYTFTVEETPGVVVNDHDSLDTKLIQILSGAPDSLHNNVFWRRNSSLVGYRMIDLGEGCSYNTFLADTGSLTCASSVSALASCSGLLVGGGTKSLNFGTRTSSTTVLSKCQSIKLESLCDGNLISASSREIIFGAYCTHNTLGSNIIGIHLGSVCASNIFSSYSSYTTLSERCYSNVLAGGNNTLGTYCNTLVLGPSNQTNTFGTNCSGIILGQGSQYNTFSPGCKNITLGSNCLLNTFGPNCIDLVFGNDMSSIEFKARIQSRNFTAAGTLYGSSFPSKTVRLSGAGNNGTVVEYITSTSLTIVNV